MTLTRAALLDSLRDRPSSTAPSVGTSPSGRRSFGRVGWVVVAAMVAAGCSASDDTGETADEVGGSWTVPSSVMSAVSGINIRYEDAGSWSGGGNCSGRLRDGARAVGRELMTRFGQITSIGGYSCRRNTANASKMSVHGSGKALDIHIPTRGGRANSSLGDPVANWLVSHAAEIGVQYIIWNRSQWKANGNNTTRYGGPVPHVDHIHAEITEKAARRQMPFFNQLEADVVDGQPLGAPANGAGDISVFDPNQPAPITVADDGHEHEPDIEDAEPGETDSLGTIREANTNTDGASANSKPIVGGCTTAPVRRPVTPSLPAASITLVLATALLRRRRVHE